MSEESSAGKFSVDFPRAVAQLESAMRRFPVKKILYRNILRGKGLEFDSYRDFEPDDDASLIDWKASLRANKTVARKYIEERELNVYFLVDVSNSMLFGSGDKLKAEYAAEAVASLAHLVLGAGDKIGLVMFNENIVKFLQPARTKNQFALFTKFLSDSTLYGGGFDINKAIRYVLGSIKTPYTIFVLISDFIYTKKNSVDSMKLMGARFESVALMIRDRLDEDLPEGNYQFAVEDPYTGRQMILDPGIARDRYKKNVAHQKAVVRQMCRDSRIDLLELLTDKNFVVTLTSFLKGRSYGGRG